MLYRSIENGPSPICSYLYLFLFLSLQFFFVKDISPQPFKIETSNLVYRFTTTSCIVGLKMGLLLFVLPYICSFFFLSRFFVKDISTTVKDWNFKFGTQVNNDQVVSWNWKWAFSYLLFPIFVLFSFSPDFSSKISPQPFKIETSYLVHNDQVVSWNWKWASSYLLFPIFVLFSFSPDFSSKISPQPFKIETSYLVHNDKLYRGIENGPPPIYSSLYLFFFLSLQIFRQRYLHNRLR